MKITFFWNVMLVGCCYLLLPAASIFGDLKDGGTMFFQTFLSLKHW